MSPNVASFVGATTVRIHEVGRVDRAPTAAELARMQALVRQAMEDGALGVGSSLIYAPAFYAKTDEFIALMQAAAPYGGMYISHIRSEGNRLLEAIDELVAIARASKAPAEIYHLKAAGKANWPKLSAALAAIEAARSEGLRITANMYTYPAGATGLDASMPPWVQEGGYNAWAARLKDPAIRRRVAAEMKTPTNAWENFFTAVEGPEQILLVGFKNDALKPLTGQDAGRSRTHAREAAGRNRDGSRHRGRQPCRHGLLPDVGRERQAADGAAVGELRFRRRGARAGRRVPQVESRIRARTARSRACSGATRATRRSLTLTDAVRRLSGLPAENLKLDRRGLLKTGYFADVVVFNPATIADHATFDKPHQYSTGMMHVFVNGVQVLRGGEHTGAKPGRVVRGPGWRSR